MQDLPHRYRVEASAETEGDVRIASSGLADLATAPPVEFGGPGDRWSPETLLMAAVADCLVLSFRAVAKASSLPWSSLRCDAEGILDRVERTTRFTGITVRAVLSVPEGTDLEKAGRILDKAERACLISNSLACPVHLEPKVEVG
jgi:organic hydroperoxide reductase OsmC/OhrA